MLHKTTGIVLHSTRYNDKTSFVHIFTKEFGNATYAITPGSSKKSGRKAALFQPLSILELEVEHKSNREIHRIKESKIAYPLKSIHSNPIKISISFFLAEFIHHTIREKSPNEPLFEFILQSIQLMDIATKGIANFHLVFLLKLTRFLGFYPNLERKTGNHTAFYFDMPNGTLATSLPPHKHYLQGKSAEVFILLMRMNYQNMHAFSFSGKERSDIIQKVIEYYRLHLSNFLMPKSFEILQTLFSE